MRSLVESHWPDADDYVFGSGQDGADRALVTAARFLSADDFNRVVIGSGDHYFVELAEHCRQLGIAVVVVSRADALSRRLAAIAGDVVTLPADYALAA